MIRIGLLVLALGHFDADGVDMARALGRADAEQLLRRTKSMM